MSVSLDVEVGRGQKVKDPICECAHRKTKHRFTLGAIPERDRYGQCAECQCEAFA